MTYEDIEDIVLGELFTLTVQAGIKNVTLSFATPLLAEGAPIDSFDLVNLVVAIEERLEREGHTIEILDEHATTGVDSPFRTVASLARHVHGKCSS